MKLTSSVARSATANASAASSGSVIRSRVMTSPATRSRPAKCSPALSTRSEDDTMPTSCPSRSTMGTAPTLRSTKSALRVSQDVSTWAQTKRSRSTAPTGVRAASAARSTSAPSFAVVRPMQCTVDPAAEGHAGSAATYGHDPHSVSGTICRRWTQNTECRTGALVGPTVSPVAMYASPATKSWGSSPARRDSMVRRLCTIRTVVGPAESLPKGPPGSPLRAQRAPSAPGLRDGKTELTPSRPSRGGPLCSGSSWRLPSRP